MYLRKIFLLALAVLVPALSWADSYCPKKGEEFVFYPVSKVYKQVIKGFDCFYVPDLAYKNGQSYPEREYRYKVDASGVTPYREIEGHTFVIENALKENADKPVSQQNFLCFLVRDDGERLLLRIPFVRKSTDNTLTRGMTVILNEKNSFRSGPSLCLINIPACPVSQLEKLSNQMKGQTLTRQKDHEVDMTVSTLVKYLNKDLGDEIIRSVSVDCDSIDFVDVRGYVFRQPIAFGTIKGKKVKLPVFDFRGNGESVYGSYFSINTVFRAPAAAHTETLLAERVTQSVLAEDAAETSVPETPKPVVADPKPEKRQAETDASVYIIEEVPVEDNLWVLDDKPKTQAKEKKAETQEKKAETIPSDPRLPENSAKAEATAPEVSLALTEERLADLTKRYGAKNAKIIADRKVGLGFTMEMCREALGEPDYINTTQNMFTILEQWVYGHDLYLYFQRGKLQSIDQF